MIHDEAYMRARIEYIAGQMKPREGRAIKVFVNIGDAYRPNNFETPFSEAHGIDTAPLVEKKKREVLANLEERIRDALRTLSTEPLSILRESQ